MVNCLPETSSIIRVTEKVGLMSFLIVNNNLTLNMTPENRKLQNWSKPDYLARYPKKLLNHKSTSTKNNNKNNQLEKE